jgi:hypothetical protein
VCVCVCVSVSLLVECVCVCAFRLVSLLGFDESVGCSLVHEFVLMFGSSVSPGVPVWRVPSRVKPGWPAGVRAHIGVVAGAARVRCVLLLGLLGSCREDKSRLEAAVVEELTIWISTSDLISRRSSWGAVRNRMLVSLRGGGGELGNLKL